MGMFKDMKNMKDLHSMSKQFERPSMSDALEQSKQAVQQHLDTQQMASELATTGVDGTATVNSLQATGAQINYQPEIQFALTVNVNGFASEVTHTQPVSPALLPQLQPGATVPIKVDPNDHTRLLLVGG